eukprot:349914_1
MTQLVRDKGWIPCARIPQNMEYGRIVRLNDEELIMVSGNTNVKTTGIFKYNTITNEWKQIIQYPDPLDLYSRNWAITLVDNTKKLYIMNDIYEIISFDLESNKMKHIPLESLEYGKLFASNHSVFVSVENKIHSIGGSLVHLMWNCDTNIITKMDHPFNEDLWGASAIYVPSKQIIILFQGLIDFAAQQYGGIWTFSLLSNKWNKIKGLTFNYHHIRSLILSFDEKYIIIAGGRMDHTLNEVKKIYILDINKWILTKSNIYCPSKGPYNIVCMGKRLKDKILVNGWIRFENKKSKEMIPIEILNLILSWFSEEEIHCLKAHSFKNDKENHFKISMTPILSDAHSEQDNE